MRLSTKLYLATITFGMKYERRRKRLYERESTLAIEE